MRARAHGAPAGAGAEHGVANGLVGIGEALPATPPTLDEAVTATGACFGAKAGRMLRRFAELPDGTSVWTRLGDGTYRLGRIAGPWRYDDSAAARAVGVHHVRPAEWLERPFGEHDVPAAVAATFARGGRNLQRMHDASAERSTAELWAARDAARRTSTSVVDRLQHPSARVVALTAFSERRRRS
ncbi:hypothetical protein Q7L65_00875 [Conexibacter sp. CPCC 206217]|nr:hypothetical protein [Conexibacter sp. CPCC 206217]